MLKIDVPDAYLLFDKNNLRKAIRESAKLVANQARALTRNAGGSGRAYSTPRHVARGVHYASASGEPPAALTGALSRSISYSVRGDRARVYDTQFYSKFLEVGAQGGAPGKRNSRARKGQPKPKPATRRVLEPRPFISRALLDNEEAIKNKLESAIASDMKFIVTPK